MIGRGKACFLCAAVLGIVGTLLLTPVSAQDSQPETKPKSAEDVFDSLVKRGEAGLTRTEAEEYLRKYDPRYSDPRLIEYAKSHPDFQQFQNQNLAQDAQKLIDVEGTDVNGDGKPVLTKDRFVQITTKPPATLKKKPPPDHLSILTGGILKDANLSITKSTTVQGDEKRPAQFGWTNNGKTSFFTIDGAVTYKVDNLPPWHFYQNQYSLTPVINFSVEAHTTTQAASKRQQDTISAKLPIELDLGSANASWISVNTFLITPTYERDRKKTIETDGVNILWSPTLVPPPEATSGPIMLVQTGQFIPLSQILPGSRANYPGLIWRPYFGFELGDRLMSDPKDIDAAKAYGSDRKYDRFVATTHVDLYLTRSFDIAIDLTHRTFLSGSEMDFDYVEVSPILYLDGTPEDPSSQHFSLGLTYKNGKTTPQFKSVRSLSAWLGVKF